MKRRVRSRRSSLLPLPLAALGLLALALGASAQSWQRVINLSEQPGSAIGGASGNTLYAGLSSGHVFRSDDNGLHWTAVTNGLVDAFGRMLLPKAFVVGTGGRVLRGGDNASWANRTGSPVFRTDDQGGTWTEVPLPFGSPTGNPGGIGISDLVQHQGALYFSDLLSGGVWKSTDNGLTWVSVGGSLPFVSSLFGITTKTYYAVASAGDALLTVEPLRGVFRSTDGGGSWAQAVNGIPGVPNSPIFGGRTWNGWDVVGAPDGTAFAVVDNLVYRSRDGGASWSQVGAGLFGARKVEILGDRVFVSSSDGNARFFEGTAFGDSWTELPRIPGGSSGGSILAQAFAAHGNALYFAGTNGIYRLDLATTVRTTIAPLAPTTPTVDRYANVGQRVVASVDVTGTAPFTYEWRLGGTPIAGQTGPALDFVPTAPGTALELSVVVRNSAGAVTNLPFRLTIGPVGPGAVDYSFQPQTPGGSPGAPVYTFAVDRDGSVFYGGDLFNLFGDVYRGLRKTFPDGTIDASFNASAGPGVGIPVRTLLPLGDGSVIVGATGNSSNERYWRRLLPGGALDPEWPWPAEMPGGAYKVQRLADGRLLVAGGSLSGLNRLLADGSPDPSFNPLGSIGTFQIQHVTDFFLQADGRIVIAGNFNSIDGVSRFALARLLPDGGLDTSFTPPTFDSPTEIRALLSLPDGRFYAGGAFTRVANESRPYLVRLNADGTRDTSFANLGFTGPINALARQSDGKVWIGGEFLKTAGYTYLLRLTADGVVDTGFADVGFELVSRGGVTTLGFERNGRLWVGGALTTLHGYRCGQFFRLFTDIDNGPLPYISGDQSPKVGTPLTLTARVVGAYTGLQWRRDGTPITGETGVTYFRPAAAAGDAGIYDLVATGPAGSLASTPVTVRVRSRVAIDAQPPSTVGILSNSVSLRVGAFGQLPLGYQWFREGTAVTRGTNATLTLTNLSLAQAGDYTVRVTGADGSEATSEPAYLTVIPQPGSPNPGFRPGLFALGSFTSTLFNDIQVLTDGRVLVAGTFATRTNGTDALLARLLPDGSLDAGFSFDPTGYFSVHALRPLPDGKLLVLARSTQGGGPYVVRRLLATGAVDPGYPGATVDGGLSLDIGPDGSAYVAGSGGVTRLSPEGIVDATFANRAGIIGGVSVVSVDPTGRLYVAGSFNSVGGVTRPQLARLFADGTLDPSFAPTNQFFGSWTIAAVADGLLVSDFSGIARFDDSGGRVSGYGAGVKFVVFDRTPVGGVAGVLGTSGGEGVILGASGTPARPFSRLALPRSNSSYSVFRSAPDGSFFLALGGNGTPTPPGLLLYKLYGSITPLDWLAQPASRTVNQGESVTFTASALGTSHIDYQWQRDGVDLPGATNNSLVLDQVDSRRVGSYTATARNRSGTIVSRPAILTVLGAPEIRVAPVPTTVGLGDILVLTVQARGAAPLSYTWRRNGAPLPTGSFASYTNLAAALGDSGTYDVVVANALGTVTAPPVEVAVVVHPGAVIRGFANPQLGAGASELAVLPDGRFLAGNLGGGLVAFQSNGVRDTNFAVVGANNTDFAERVAVDAVRNRILVSPASVLRAYNFQGVPTNGFTAPASTPRLVRVEAAGTVLVADNSFSAFFRRLDVNGAVVSTFQPAIPAIMDAQPTSDGKVLVLSFTQGFAGGSFVYPTRIARLLADGTVDPTFQVLSNTFAFAKRALRVQPDRAGRVLVYGEFETFAGQPRSRLARLNADGSLDATFQPPPIDGPIQEIAEQANGKLVIVGEFTHVGGLSRSLVARLLPTGEHDVGFDPGAGLTRTAGQNVAFDLKLLDGGQILVAGTFDKADGQPRQGVALLTGDAPDTEPPADPLVAWAAAAGLTGAQALPEADPDHDGADNAAEFAHGSAPNDPASRPVFPVGETTQAGASYPTVTFVRRQSLGSLTLGVQASSSVAFGDDLGTTLVSSTPAGEGLERVVLRSNAAVGVQSAQFFRVRLQKP